MSTTRAYKWQIVFMLWFVCFLNYGDRQAISSILPKLHDEFGFSKVQQGMIVSAFMWVYAFGGPIAGYAGDRLRRKDLILGGCLFWSVVTMTTAWCGKLWQFVTVRAMEGFGETFYFPATMSLISDYHDSSTRSKALAFHQSSVYAGTIAGSWIAAWLAEYYNWRLGFYLFGGCGVVLAMVLFVFVREPARGQSDGQIAERPLTLNVMQHAFLRPSVLMMMAAFVLANFVATIFMAWTTTFLHEKFHLELAQAALKGSLYVQLASAVGAPLGGVLSDRFSRHFQGGRTMVQACGLTFASIFLFVVGTTHDLGMLFIAMAFFGLGKGLYDSNIFASLFDAVEPSARGTAAGIMNTVGWGGGALGPLVMGYFAQHGGYGSEVENMSHVIAWTGAIYVAGAVLLCLVALIFIRRDREEMMNAEC